MAAKAQDYTKIMKDLMGAFPVDMSAMQGAFKTQATLGEKLSKVALEAADKSAEISTRWTRDTLAKLAEVTTAKEDPADYTKALTDFAAAQAEMTAESLAAFAEVAKRVQMETVELMLAAGKDFSEDASAAVKKATEEVTRAAKKAAAPAK
ncbi:MAG: Phasin [Alphaproteobacteria bacterium]|nr:MAG: Phasin [Alphaproteobacteria bacterium]